MTALTGYNRFLACKHILSEKLDWNAKNSRSMQQAPQVQTRRKMKTKKKQKTPYHLFCPTLNDDL